MTPAAAPRDRPVGGHYLLLLRLAAPTTIPLGTRPPVALDAGWYVYAGSAQGAGGLAARLARHRRAEKKQHWHIDWLLPHVDLVDIVERPGASGRECPLVQTLLARGGRSAVPHFGSGDCRCAGHLVWFAARPDLAL